MTGWSRPEAPKCPSEPQPVPSVLTNPQWNDRKENNVISSFSTESKYTPIFLNSRIILHPIGVSQMSVCEIRLIGDIFLHLLTQKNEKLATFDFFLLTSLNLFVQQCTSLWNPKSYNLCFRPEPFDLINEAILGPVFQIWFSWVISLFIKWWSQLTYILIQQFKNTNCTSTMWLSSILSTDKKVTDVFLANN